MGFVVVVGKGFYLQIYDQKVGQISEIMLLFSLRSWPLRSLFTEGNDY